MRKIIISYTGLCIMAMSLILTGCAKTETAQEEIPFVRTQTVKMDDLSQSASYAGEVRGRYETPLSFQVSGKIIKRNVELGSVVHPGDILMEIDSKDIQQTVNINSAQVYSAESQLNLAQSNLERYRQLLEQGAVSRAQFDQYQNTYEVALASVRQLSAQYVQGTNQLGYSTLSSDSAGVISSISAEAGQVVSAGQAVLTLVKDGEREVEINIPENRIEELRRSRQIAVSFWALPGVFAEGKVREISPIADKISRTYKVRIALINPPTDMNLGMTSNVTVQNSTVPQKVYIPLSAIYQNGDTPNVWIINNGVVSLRPIKVGAFEESKVQILEGLQDGDVIVIAGVQKLRDGQKVRI